jgi:transposase
MTSSKKYIGMDVHKESISIAVMNAAGKMVMECVIETKASMILQFIDGLRGDVQVTFEEGTWAAWLYDLLKPHVSAVVVCNPRKNALLKDGSKSDRIDARKLAELLRGNHLKPVYHGEHGLRTLKELARSYLTITKDLTRVMNRLKALYRSWGIPCGGNEVYAPCHRSEWLGRIREAGVRRRAEHSYQETGCLTSVAPAGTPGSVAGKQEAPGMETASSDSWDRPDPRGLVDRADPDASSVPHQTTTMDL